MCQQVKSANGPTTHLRQYCRLRTFFAIVIARSLCSWCVTTRWSWWNIFYVPWYSTISTILGVVPDVLCRTQLGHSVLHSLANGSQLDVCNCIDRARKRVERSNTLQLVGKYFDTSQWATSDPIPKAQVVQLCVSIAYVWPTTKRRQYQFAVSNVPLYVYHELRMSQYVRSHRKKEKVSGEKSAHFENNNEEWLWISIFHVVQLYQQSLHCKNSIDCGLLDIVHSRASGRKTCKKERREGFKVAGKSAFLGEKNRQAVGQWGGSNCRASRRLHLPGLAQNASPF